MLKGCIPYVIIICFALKIGKNVIIPSKDDTRKNTNMNVNFFK